MKKEKELRNYMQEIKKKIKHYHTFPDHLDVQPIPFTISSFKFDSTLGVSFTILGSQLACLKIFS
jgi:hypothetical protein